MTDEPWDITGSSLPLRRTPRQFGTKALGRTGSLMRHCPPRRKPSRCGPAASTDQPGAGDAGQPLTMYGALALLMLD
jgi:hypothetical protein